MVAVEWLLGPYNWGRRTPQAGAKDRRALLHTTIVQGEHAAHAVAVTSVLSRAHLPALATTEVRFLLPAQIVVKFPCATCFLPNDGTGQTPTSIRTSCLGVKASRDETRYHVALQGGGGTIGVALALQRAHAGLTSQGRQLHNLLPGVCS